MAGARAGRSPANTESTVAHGVSPAAREPSPGSAFVLAVPPIDTCPMPERQEIAVPAALSAIMRRAGLPVAGSAPATAVRPRPA